MALAVCLFSCLFSPSLAPGREERGTLSVGKNPARARQGGLIPLSSLQSLQGRAARWDKVPVCASLLCVCVSFYHYKCYKDVRRLVRIPLCFSNYSVCACIDGPKGPGMTF